MTTAVSDNESSGVVVQIQERVNQVRILNIPLEKISLSPFQTREIISDSELETLAHSIKEKGVLQPVIVRMITREGDLSEHYELVAGERRLRASKLAGAHSIPAIVKNLDERSAAEVSVIENAQRENLDPIEEARAFQQLTTSFKLTQTEVAELVGKNRSTISNALRLLQLDQKIQIMIRQGHLVAGHGRALLQLEQRKQVRFAERAVRDQLSVHALEQLVAKALTTKSVEPEDIEEKERLERLLRRQESKISELLRIEEVKVAVDDEGRRQVKLTFDSDTSWRRFMKQLKS